MLQHRRAVRPAQRPFRKGAEEVYRRMLNDRLLCPIEPLPQQIVNRFHDSVTYIDFDSIVRRALLPFLLRTVELGFLASGSFEY